MELNYFNYSVIQFLNIFLFVIIYSTVYSPAVLFFHKFNWTEQHSVCIKENDRFANFPFTVIILFVLFFLLCDVLLPFVCVFQSIVCIWYSSCPVLFCQHTQTVNSWTELHYCTLIMYRTICIATDSVNTKLSAAPHIFT